MPDLIKYQPAPTVQDNTSEPYPYSWKGETADMGELISIVRDNLLLGLGVGAGVALIVLFIFLQMTPIYTANAVVVIETRDQEIVDVDNVLSALSDSADVVETEVKILKSSNIAEQVVDKLGLGINDEFSPADTGTQYDPAATRSEEDAATAALDIRKRREAIVATVQNNLSAYRDGDTFALIIEFNSAIPERAAQIANAFSQTYVESQAAEKRQANKRANDLLKEQIDTLAVAVEKSEAAVEIYRADAGLLDTDGSTMIEQQNASLAAELATLENEMAGHLAKLSILRALEEGGQSAESMSDMVESPLMSQLRSQKAGVEREYNDLATKYGPRHPSLVGAQKRLQTIQSDIRAEIARQATSIRLDAETSQQRVAFIEKRSTELRTALTKTRSAEVRLRELERQAETDRTLYENFLARFKETSAQQDMQQGDARIISTANIPTSPSWPKRSVIMLASGTLGLSAGMIAIFVAGFMSSGFRTPRELETATGFPCLATLPHIGPKRLGISPSKTYRQSQYLENVKAIYTDVISRMTVQDDPTLVVAVVSSMPGEAKTSTVLSLAQSASERGLRTLCIDGDGRRRRLSAKFLKAKGDMTDRLLTVQAGTPIYARQTDQENLSVLLAEDFFAGHKELDPERCEKILSAARAEFDLIVFDTPPLLALVDARWIAAKADVSYLAVRWQRTPRQLLAETITIATRAGVQIGGTILTRVAPNRSGIYAPYYDPKMSKQLQAYFEDGNQRTKIVTQETD